LLQTDSAARATYFNTLTGGGLMTLNEARRKLNLPPLPGGDVLRVQMQDIPVANQPGTGGTAPITDNEGEQA
jgi:hypothetical protein